MHIGNGGGIGVAGAQELDNQGSDAPASNSIGHGLVRIDSSWVTTRTLADGTRVLTFAKHASGQWMGEVGPQQQLMVRDINVKRLVRAWNRLGHNRQKVTPKGHLRFHLDPGAHTPQRMKNITFNLSRPTSISARTYPVTSTYALSSTGSVTTTNSFASQANISLSDSGLRCYVLTLVQAAPVQSLPSKLKCGSLTFTTGQFSMSLPVGSQNGSVLFTSNMLASGTPFAFNAIVASWLQSGS